MTRLTGIRVLILGVVLWALAVWIFSATHPAATEPVAETSAKKTAESATVAGDGIRAEAAVTPAPPAAAKRDPASPPGPGTEAGHSSLRAPPASTAEAGTVPAAPAVTGDGAQIVRAPIAPVPAGNDSTIAAGSDAAWAGVESVPGAPIMPPVPGTGSWQGNVPDTGDAGTTAGGSLALALPAPRLEPPIPRTLPPAGPPMRRPGGAGSENGAVTDQLNAARRAVWEGRLADALVHYRAAARIQPNSHFVWGEMGNVLWAMRRWSEAAYALEGAATLLVDDGEFSAAYALLPAVRDIDPEAAQRVQRRLWATSQRQPG